MMSQCNSPILIIGFGSQAKSWALNLRDSGFDVHVILRQDSSSIKLVKSLGFKTLFFGESNLKSYSIFLMLTPDHAHESILKTYREDFPYKSNFIYFCMRMRTSQNTTIQHAREVNVCTIFSSTSYLIYAIWSDGS